MPVYVIIDHRGSLKSRIEEKFNTSDVCKVGDQVSFVRSTYLTAAEVAKSLEIKASDQVFGIVARVTRYSGAAERAIVQKLSAWDEESG